MSEMISNRYLLVKKIGSGGMADVYLAMDTVLNREVALKKLRGDLSHDPVALLRFQREANAASGINHPNIVEIYDVGQDGDQHYIVMEVVRGTTLKQLVQRRGALDKYEAVAITKQLASGLVKAHDCGVIHRDVKPQNVLIKDDGTVKITDFGIALAGDALQLTRDDSVLGSVHYMAPECSRGEGASIQSDVYSLGVVFFELLTGTLPFRGETPVEIAMKHLRDPFPSVLDSNPTLPNSLENIIAKSTHKNKNYRYTNMHEFLDDLETCLFENRKDEPLWQPEEESDDETKVINKLDTVDSVEDKKPKSRKKLWISLSAILIVALGIFTYWFFSPSKSSTVELPDLTKMTVNEAEAILKEKGLIFNSSNLVHIYSDDLESGYVISSRPEGGEMVKKGTEVKLTVSSGKNFVIDDYTGKTFEEVSSILNGKNVKIKRVNEPRKDMSEGIVLRQELLLPGEKINPENPRDITLVVSSKVETVLPNDLVGKSLDDASSQLTDLGVKVSRKELSQDGLSLSEIKNLKYGVVVRTDPMPGSYYVQTDSSSVTLYYYTKKAEPEKPEPDTENNNNDNNDQKPETNDD